MAKSSTLPKPLAIMRGIAIIISLMFKMVSIQMVHTIEGKLKKPILNMKDIVSWNLLELALRIWTAFFIFVYGIAKHLQFAGAKASETPINEAGEFEIMWAFFGTTTIYPVIIGILQIIGAFLLLFNKTKLLGAVLLTPIFINIILLDIFYHVPFGALLNALIFQAVFILIIILERQKVLAAFKALQLSRKHKLSWKVLLVKFIIATILAFLMFLAYNYIMVTYL